MTTKENQTCHPRDRITKAGDRGRPAPPQPGGWHLLPAFLLNSLKWRHGKTCFSLRKRAIPSPVWRCVWAHMICGTHNYSLEPWLKLMLILGQLGFKTKLLRKWGSLLGSLLRGAEPGDRPEFPSQLLSLHAWVFLLQPECMSNAQDQFSIQMTLPSLLKTKPFS